MINDLNHITWLHVGCHVFKAVVIRAQSHNCSALTSDAYSSDSWRTMVLPAVGDVAQKTIPEISMVSILHCFVSKF